MAGLLRIFVDAAILANSVSAFYFVRRLAWMAAYMVETLHMVRWLRHCIGQYPINALDEAHSRWHRVDNNDSETSTPDVLSKQVDFFWTLVNNMAYNWDHKCYVR